ncbi:hypothetical protein HAX54_040371, partial [Datura stramonium]|nr:hypothetical protein [Datura stramonium]
MDRFGGLREGGEGKRGSGVGVRRLGQWTEKVWPFLVIAGTVKGEERSAGFCGCVMVDCFCWSSKMVEADEGDGEEEKEGGGTGASTGQQQQSDREEENDEGEGSLG